jgi:hypothetical protein
LPQTAQRHDRQITCRSRIGQQYPQADSAGKSPDRERESSREKMHVVSMVRNDFCKIRLDFATDTPFEIPDCGFAASSDAQLRIENDSGG